MQSMSERDNRLYVEDMLEFCCASLAYSAGLTEATLTAEAMRYDAILRNLELIGEAATHVPDAVRAMAPNVPWRQVVATRNRVAHGYLGFRPPRCEASCRTTCQRLKRRSVLCWC